MSQMGWIKLHRKLLDNPIFQNAELLQLFLYCLLKANHEPKKILFNGKEELIGRGQFITGREVISKDLKQNAITSYKRLKTLENLEILNIKSNNRFSLVTIENYELYQTLGDDCNNEMNNKGTTEEQQGNNKGTQPRMNKKIKNDKELKESIVLTPLEQTILDFKAMRKQLKKPMTDKAVELMLKKLDGLSKGDEYTKIAILNQSIMNSWQGIFELKGDFKNGGDNRNNKQTSAEEKYDFSRFEYKE